MKGDCWLTFFLVFAAYLLLFYVNPRDYKDTLAGAAYAYIQAQTDLAHAMAQPIFSEEGE